MFGEKLKELRKQNSLTQEGLAQIICVSRSAVNKWEQGIGLPSDINLKSICEYFNVSEEWLLDRKDLKEYIKSDKEFKAKSMIISLVGIILPILFILFTFVGIFKFKCNIEAEACIMIYISPKSIYHFLEAGVIIPIICYVITITISFINVLQVIKEEKAKKLIITNLVLIFISVLLFIASFIIACVLAKENSFGL